MEENHTAQLKEWIAREDRSALLAAFQNMHPADGGKALAELTPEEVAQYIETVGPANALFIFEFVPFEMQKETLVHMPRKVLAELFSLMSPDDRADLVEEMDENFQERLLSLLLQAERQNILKLISYPEDCAGAHMTTNYALLRPDDNIRRAMEQLRLQAPKKETIYYAYVVDHARKLIGFVSLRDLIMAPGDSLIRDIMHENVIYARAEDDIEEVAREISHYDFLAMPVVDRENRLVGIITYDDIFDILDEEATEDMYRLANLDTDEKVSSPLPRSVKLRAPWLFVNLLTALVVAYTVSIFSDTIDQYVALAALMPIVAMLGGNAGNQSLTVVVRALALGEIQFKGNRKVVLKEMGVGLCNGFIAGVVLGLIAFAWYGNMWLAMILWMAMVANLVVAGLSGALVPIVLRKLKLDPALGSSIFVTTATDVGGFVIFLGLATLLLGRLIQLG
jgi:magnesium transporter